MRACSWCDEEVLDQQVSGKRRERQGRSINILLTLCFVATRTGSIEGDNGKLNLCVSRLRPFYTDNTFIDHDSG